MAEPNLDVRPYAAAWRRRLAAERSTNRRAAASARRLAGRCASVLVEDFGAARVYLFGSLAASSSHPFGPRSDVDLAVEGLADDRYFEALRALDRVTADAVPLDLVPIETAPPSMREHILRCGELLSERA